MPTVDSPIRECLDALFPWAEPSAFHHPLPPYPGRIKGIRGLIGPRAARSTVLAWLAGRRSAPRWLTKLLWDELERRKQIIIAAQASLEHYQHGHGPGDVTRLREGWRKKRAAEAAQNNNAASTD